MIKVTPIDKMGTDLTVVNAARVSFGKVATTLKDNDKKLIKYLADHEHISPFGHCFASFHIKAPMFVARQLVKHEYLRWNEISRRYVDTPPEFHIPKEWRRRSADKKQGSDGALDSDTVSYVETCLAAVTEYDNLIARGVAPEQARMVLPLSTMTEWYWSGSLDAFANMCILRLAEDTQKETREVAQGIDGYMKQWYPISWEALVYDS